MIKPIDIITALRESDGYIEAIYTEGSCYRFFIFLKALYPLAISYINSSRTHIITRIGGKYYDITGEIEMKEVEHKGFRLMDALEKEFASGWSFQKNNYLRVGECPVCEEPLLIP